MNIWTIEHVLSLNIWTLKNNILPFILPFLYQISLVRKLWILLNILPGISYWMSMFYSYLPFHKKDSKHVFKIIITFMMKTLWAFLVKTGPIAWFYLLSFPMAFWCDAIFSTRNLGNCFWWSDHFAPLVFSFDDSCHIICTWFLCLLTKILHDIADLCDWICYFFHIFFVATA